MKHYCIAFVRASTDKQDLESQIKAVNNEASRRGYDSKHIIDISYHESGVSLREEERKGIQRTKECIYNNPDIDCVIVYEFSRISRNAKVAFSFRDFLADHQIQLCVITPYVEVFGENWLPTPQANLLFSIYIAFAETEAQLLKERTKRGRAENVASGKFDGGNILYGYVVDDKGYFHINEDEAELVRKIFDMSVNQGMSGYQIGTELYKTGTLQKSNAHNCISFVNRLLMNPSYAGHGRLGYPAIVSDELFNAARDKAKDRRNIEKTSSKYPYLCRNLLFDSVSGASMSPIKKDNCYVFGRTGYKTCTLSMSKIEALIWSIVYERSKKKIDVKGMIAVNDKKLKTAENNLAKMKPKEQKLVNMYLNDTISKEVYESSYSALRKEMSQLESEISQYTNEAERLYAMKLKYAGHECFEEVDYSIEEKQKLVREHIKRINVTNLGWRHHSIEIIYKDGSKQVLELDF